MGGKNIKPRNAGANVSDVYKHELQQVDHFLIVGLASASETSAAAQRPLSFGQEEKDAARR
jgi:hypothetical protein